ncbi:hypothetical protein BGZ76_006765, partial [Entomortierella beljakovae]
MPSFSYKYTRVDGVYYTLLQLRNPTPESNWADVTDLTAKINMNDVAGNTPL